MGRQKCNKEYSKVLVVELGGELFSVKFFLLCCMFESFHIKMLGGNG